MRKILLLIMVTGFCSGQNIEIRLSNAAIGTSLNSGDSNFSNSETLNTILQANNVLTYETKLGHPYPDFTYKIVNANCNNCNTTQLISDLTNSGIVEFAQVYSPNVFSDALYVKILNSNVGTMTGTSNGIVTTNDTGLNLIFEDFNVFYYNQYAPSSSNPETLKVHMLACNCNNIELKNALDTYTNIIQSTNYIGRVFLDNPEFKTNKIKFYPNPFQNYFEIESDENISNYKLFDLSGKLYLDTNSKEELRTKVSALSSGVYFLKFEIETGKWVTKKIVKN